MSYRSYKSYSFVTQRHQRVDFRGPPRGNVTSNERSNDERECEEVIREIHILRTLSGRPTRNMDQLSRLRVG